VVIAIGLAVGCSGSSDRTITVNVFAAASLTDAFGAVETAFEAAILMSTWC
jgi:ABC-type molybdate transport system substrate-binding protein